MSDSEAEAAAPAPAASGPYVRVRTTHTGAEFEGQLLNRNRGVHRPDVQEVDGREEPATVGRPRGIAAFLSGTQGGDDAPEQNGRRVRQKAPQSTQVIEYKGQQLTVYKGTHAAEDQRWVLVLDVNPNGTKKYKCVACGWERTCKIGVVIGHLMRTEGVLCRKTPTEVMVDKLSRFVPSASSTLSTAVKTPAVGQTPGVACAFEKSDTLSANTDEAIAKLVCTFDLSWAAFDSRNPLWVNVIKAIKAAPSYSAPKRETLSNHRPPVGEARPGGLYLANEACRRERRTILKSTTGELGLGGTLVSTAQLHAIRAA